MQQENEQNRGLQHSRVIQMPDREILTRKFQGLGVLGVSEQTNRFWNSLAENLNGVELNGAGLVLVWETTLDNSLGQYGQMMVSMVGMSFDKVVDAITTDERFASSAKKIRQELLENLRDSAKAAEPKLEDLGQEDSLGNFERFQQAHKIADIIFEYVGIDYKHAKNDVTMEDRRDESANPYYGQTHRGFFLEAYYGALSHLWTPWGKYDFGGSGLANGWKKITPEILERFGATIHKPKSIDRAGEHGPVYALHKVDGVELPDPIERPRSKFRSYEGSDNAWEELRKKYFESKGEAIPLTGAGKSQLDQNLLEERGLKEQPINENDIRDLWELTFQKGKVVKYTKDGGKTWRYTKIGNSDPVYYSGGDLGFHADEEVLPNTQVHSSIALTESDFQKGMVIRPTTEEEIKGMKFSYDFKEREV